MKHLPVIATITLIFLLGLAPLCVEREAKAKTIPAAATQAANYPLDPNNFTSLGASPFTSAGTYTINASKNNTAPGLSGPGIVTPIRGVFFSPSGGAQFNLGQSVSPNDPWPRTELKSFTRTVDYEKLATRNEAVGLQAPLATQFLADDKAWGQGGTNITLAPPAATAERRLQLWLTPHGFLKGALANNATAKKSGKTTIVAGNAHADNADAVAGRFEVKYVAATSNCESIVMSLQHNAFEIKKMTANTVAVAIDRIPVMQGSANTGGRVTATSKLGPTAIQGIDGRFAVTGMVGGDGVLQMLLAAEYYKNGKAY
jgi:hypothetical protein